MAEPERGFYGGGEPPLTLGDRSYTDRSGGERRAQRAPRGRGPAPVTLIVSVLVLLVAAGGLAWLYRSGARGSGEAPQPVGASLRDVRVAAPRQSEAADPAAGLSIYKDHGASTGQPAFAPPPEEPTARPSAAPPAVASPPAAEVPGQAPAAPPDRGDAIGALIDRTARPAAKPQRLAQANAPAEAATRAASGPAEVQIGAFSSTAQADEGWNAVAAAAPGAMVGKGKTVVPVTRNGATLYRTFVTGFASREAAQALCSRLLAAGKTCIVR